MTEPAWAAALDGLEQELAVLESAAAADEAPPVLLWEPPEEDGLPPSLHPRARALLERLRACEALLVSQRDGLAGELGGMANRRTVARRYAGRTSYPGSSRG